MSPKIAARPDLEEKIEQLEWRISEIEGDRDQAVEEKEAAEKKASSSCYSHTHVISYHVISSHLMSCHVTSMELGTCAPISTRSFQIIRSHSCNIPHITSHVHIHIIIIIGS